MRKCLYLLWVLLIISFMICTCNAEEVLELNEAIIEFKCEDNYGLQGFTATDKNLFIVLTGYEDTKSIIKVYNLETLKEVKVIKGESVGHANDVTYNKSNNKIYVLVSGGSDKILTFKGDSFEYDGSFNIGLPARSIAYIDDYDMYAVRTVSVGYMLDNNFELLSKSPFIVGMNLSLDLAKQGWTYYKENIYYSNWSWIRYGGDGSNIIYVYDLYGHLKDTLYTEVDIGELEDVAFYNNKMILGFDGYDGNIKFYMIDAPIIEEKEIVSTEEANSNESNNSYIYYLVIIIIIISLLLVGFLYKRKKMGI